jgi:hypothetical protein
MAEDFFDEEEYEGPPLPLFWRILGKVIKYSAIGLVVFINAFLLWRVFFSTNEPSAIKTIAGNDALSSSYEAYLADTELQKKPFALYQAEKDNIATDEAWHKTLPDDDPRKKTNQFAQFFLTEVVFFPTANQSQIVLRYNRSTLEHLVNDFDLDEVPGKSEDVFEVVLAISYKPDADSAVRQMHVKATPCADGTTALYSFRRYSFEDMPKFESITDMNVVIYYKGDAEKNIYASIDVYDPALSLSKYELDKKDLDAIK